MAGLSAVSPVCYKRLDCQCVLGYRPLHLFAWPLSGRVSQIMYACAIGLIASMLSYLSYHLAIHLSDKYRQGRLQTLTAPTTVLPAILWQVVAGAGRGESESEPDNLSAATSLRERVIPARDVSLCVCMCVCGVCRDREIEEL